ncbi:MAG: hypothetical protein C0391_01565 [Anaerolinea sp.]|nr:hypothetical protein [Anaerolinea sp.]
MSEQIEMPASPAAPEKYQAITIIMLVNGIINVLIGLTFTWGAISTIVGILCLPITVLPLVLGAFEVVYAAKMLSNKTVPASRIKTLAIFEIVGIIYGNAISLIAGILNLVFLDDDTVKAYLPE